MTRPLVALALALAACTPVQRDAVTRDAARSVIGRVVVARLPGFPVGPAIDCVIGNATGAELRALAAETVTGPTAAATQTVTAIATRPGTLRCLATEGLPAFAT